MSTMNVAPEVRDFLATVRTQLADLDPDEQREILDGLEADLTDLVAERGGDALGDPVAYARELRAAAGLAPEMASGRSAASAAARVHAVLDASRGWWDRTSAALPGDAGGFLRSLRPVWWILRGWVAVELLDAIFGRGRYAGDLSVVPHLRGLGWVVLVVAVAGSVQIGRGKLWPGTPSRGVAARLLILALNLVALVLLPLIVQQVDDQSSATYSRGFGQGYQNGLNDARQDSIDQPKAGLYADGKWVSNIYPYDAKGRPLVGVQLFNQIGQPIDVITQPEYADEGCEIEDDGTCISYDLPEDQPKPRIFYPWTNGTTQVLNVFPIPSRLQESEELSPTAFTEAEKPTVGPFPLASVPQVSLPGITPGVQQPAR